MRRLRALPATSTPSDSRELGWLDFPSLALSAVVGGRHTGQPCSDADPSCRACSGADPNMVIVLDEIAIPAGIPAGDYVLGFRASPVLLCQFGFFAPSLAGGAGAGWDCEVSAQVWAACADVTIE